jgi:hypothetical protein
MQKYSLAQPILTILFFSTQFCANGMHQKQSHLIFAHKTFNTNSLSAQKIKKNLKIHALNNIAHQKLSHNHEHILKKSIDLFHSTPGYFKLLNRLLKSAKSDVPAHFNGYLFELETAFAIIQNSNEKIIEFGRIITKDRRLKREIDVITNLRWIECKTTCKKISKIKKQIVDQKLLADEFNQTIQNPISYEVHFQQSISPHLMTWLKNRGIAYRMINEEKKQS